MGEAEQGKEISGNLGFDINLGFRLPLPQCMYPLLTNKQED